MKHQAFQLHAGGLVEEMTSMPATPLRADMQPPKPGDEPSASSVRPLRFGVTSFFVVSLAFELCHVVSSMPG